MYIFALGISNLLFVNAIVWPFESIILTSEIIPFMFSVILTSIKSPYFASLLETLISIASEEETVIL